MITSLYHNGDEGGLHERKNLLECKWAFRPKYGGARRPRPDLVTLMRRITILLALGIALAVSSAGQAQAVLPPDGAWDDLICRTRIAPALLKLLVTGRPDARMPIVVTMHDEERPAGAERSGPARVEALRASAARSQSGVRAFLAGEQSAGRVEAVHPFWIFNGLALRAAPQTIYALAARDDVELIQADEFSLRIKTGPGSRLPSEFLNLEWGVERVQADRVWAAFDITGTGVVVANTDTGVDFLHPALQANYRGNAGKNLYLHGGNWFDAVGGTTYPYDGNGHGTHVMGTLAGQAGIGVAPGARWIAARVLDSQGYGYDSWIHAGFEWMLAPGGDPALAPDVLSNSWGNPLSSLTSFQADLARLREAGIVTVFSAGNNGPGSGSVNSPASLPGALAVGATDSDDQVASFSSRGPSPWGEVKPDIAAPGVNVRSALPGGAYAVHDGTSMATPHVAGTAALMLAANPSLTVAAVEYVLTSTARPLSTALPSNDTGWGLVDAYAAVQAVAGAGTLSGVVIDAASHLPLPGAAVRVRHYDSGRVLSTHTGSDGRYAIGLTSGLYSVTAALFGYTPAAAPHTLVITGQTSTSDLELGPLPVGIARGVLTDTLTGRPVTATVSALGTPLSQEAFGLYQFALPVGTYTLQARGLGHRVVTATITINADRVTRHNFGLTPTQRLLLVNTGAWYYREYPGYFRRALDELQLAYDEWRVKDVLTDSPTLTDLLKYDAVIWSSPEDSPGYIGADAVLAQFLAAGGGLILTGQDVAFWDGGGITFVSAPYLRDYLKVDYVRDDAESETVAGRPGDCMAGLSFDIAGGDGADNQFAPDEIAVAEPDYAASVLAYDGDGSAGQKVGLCLPYRAVMLPFGYEAIGDAGLRREVLRRALEYLVSLRQADGLNVTLTSPQTQAGELGAVITFTARARNVGEVGRPVSYTAAVQSAGWTAAVSPTQFVLSPCASIALAVYVTVPVGLKTDVRNELTLTVRTLASPAQTLTFTAKTPALVLVVDDDRWRNVEEAYTQALDRIGVAYDVWQVPWSGTGTDLNGPPFKRLAQYPIVVWFNGYDWYNPLTAYDEEQLAAYLDGGGRLMLSSAFYLDLRGDSSFARARLGVLSHAYGMTATYTYGSPGHPLGAGWGQIRLLDPFPGAAFFTLDHALVPEASTDTAWRGDHHRAHAIARRQPGNRLVFWGIPFEALPDDARAAVLQRTLGWLGALGDSSVQVEPPAVSIGQASIVTLTVRNNLRDTLAAFTATLPSLAAPDLSALPPGVVYHPISNTLTWSGTVGAGAARPFTFRITPRAAPQTAQLPGRVVFHDQASGLDFDQPLVWRVDTPDLHGQGDRCAPSRLTATVARPGRSTTVTMRLCNDGPGLAPGAIMTGLAPLHLPIVPGTLAVQGPGTAGTGKSSVTWHGPLDSGQSVTLTYCISVPLRTRRSGWPVEMLAWDGRGGAWEWRTWLSVPRPYLPLVLKT